MSERYRNFHEGEARLQQESGVDTGAFDRRVEQPFQPALSDVEVRFVNERTFSVAATIDNHGRPWASPLVGPPGELFVVETPTTVRINPRRAAHDPLHANIDAAGELGVLYFDPPHRRRVKSLGRATINADGSIRYEMHRAFGLCNKYIFKRSHSADPTAATLPPAEPTLDIRDVRHALVDADRAQLERADTIFLASYHPDHGADATHRGGPPGFVTVINNTTVSIPDFLGNGMFQTLGNVLLDNRIGLLGIDFATGRTIQLTGRGSIVTSPADDPFSVRTLVIEIDEVQATSADIGQWTDLEAFDFRPGLRNPATPYQPTP
jgi:uncharacterized protein